MANVEIYYKTWCPYCQRALALLDAKGVSYTGIDVTTDTVRELEMRERSGGTSVPQIFVDGRHIGGSDDLAILESTGHLDRLLDRSEAVARSG